MRVLVVDDHPDTADLLQMVLQSAGHNVRVAYDGTQAAVLAAEHAPEVAFIDIHLPDMTGYTVAKELRKQFGRRIQLVGITGGDTKRLPMSGSFDQHAIKPVTAARLYQIIELAREALRDA